MSEKTSGFTVSDQLLTIARWNPGINLSSSSIAAINAGDLVLVGHGSILNPNPGGIFNPGGTKAIQKGCIDYLRYQESSKVLTFFRIDGARYQPRNLKDFQEILEKAAFHGKCINFCYNKKTGIMDMLNVYPQCCCRCDEVRD